MVGDVMRQARLRWCAAHGKRVDDVTEALQVPRPTLYLWESARGRPDPVDIRRVLTFYECGEDEICEALRLRSLPAPVASAPLT